MSRTTEPTPATRARVRKRSWVRVFVPVALILVWLVGASLGALLYAIAREGISLAGWDPRWFQAFLGLLLLVALLANGVVRRRLRAVPRS